ncbi:MAG: DinB family protein [Bacteroidota bacterium]
MKNTLLTTAKYNLWANTALLEVMLGLGVQDIDKELVSSFSSLRQTWLHIWDAEYIWGKRLQGENPTEFPSKNSEKTVGLTQILDVSTDLVALITRCDAAFLRTKCTYTTTSGKTYSQLPAEMLQHCFNHSTFHRGQVVTLLRMLGVDSIPPTDLIRYFRIFSGQA